MNFLSRINATAGIDVSGTTVLTNASAAAVPLTIVGAASQSTDFFAINDSGSVKRFGVNQLGQLQWRSDSEPISSAIYNGTPGGANQGLGRLTANGISTGTTLVTSGSAGFFSDGAWSSTSCPTYYAISLTPSGATGRTNRFAVSASGNVVTNFSGSAVSTSATDGFLHVPNMAGKPTGAASAYTGASPIVFDTTNGCIWSFRSSQWLCVGPGKPMGSKSANYSMTAQDPFIRCTAASTMTLPPLANVPVGWETTILGYNTTASTFNITIQANASEQINGSASATKKTRTIAVQDADGYAGVAGWRVINMDGTTWIMVQQ
jgi:hypothetical protein